MQALFLRNMSHCKLMIGDTHLILPQRKNPLLLSHDAPFLILAAA